MYEGVECSVAYGELVDEGSDVEAQRGFGSLHGALLEQRVRLYQHAVDHNALGENAAAFLQETSDKIDKYINDYKSQGRHVKSSFRGSDPLVS